MDEGPRKVGNELESFRLQNQGIWVPVYDQSINQSIYKSMNLPRCKYPCTARNWTEALLFLLHGSQSWMDFDIALVVSNDFSFIYLVIAQFLTMSLFLHLNVVKYSPVVDMMFWAHIFRIFAFDSKISQLEAAITIV